MLVRKCAASASDLFELLVGVVLRKDAAKTR
jgi:hypothetical protein